MTLARFNLVVQDESGIIIDGASVEVRSETSGLPLASLTSDRAGTVPLGNPFVAADGAQAGFYVAGGAYQVRVYTGLSGSPTFERIWQNVGIGRASEFDVTTDVTLAAASDLLLPTEHAVKTYVDSTLTAALSVSEIPTTANPVILKRINSTDFRVRQPIIHGKAGEFWEWIVRDIGPSIGITHCCTLNSLSSNENGVVREQTNSTLTGSSVFEYAFYAGLLADPFDDTHYGYYGNGHGNIGYLGLSISMDGGANLRDMAVGDSARGASLVFAQDFSILLPKDHVTVIGAISSGHTFDATGIQVDHAHNYTASGIGINNCYMGMFPFSGCNRAKFGSNAAIAVDLLTLGQGGAQGQNTSILFWHSDRPDLVIEMSLPTGTPGSPDGWTKVTTSDEFLIKNYDYTKGYINSMSGNAALAAINTSHSVKYSGSKTTTTTGAMTLIGQTDCSANPNYPGANRGDMYAVSVAGKIGGASGTAVEQGDFYVCMVDASASGDQATVGANWGILQKNIVGAVTGPATSTSGEFALFNGATGKAIIGVGNAPSVDGTFAGNSDNNFPSEKAIKTFYDARTGAIEFKLTGVNFNAANTDHAIAITLPGGVSRYRLEGVRISNASASLTTATCGVFSAAGGGGTAIVTGGSAITVSTGAANTANNMQQLTLAVSNTTTSLNFTTLYFRVGTAQGSAATADVTFLLFPLT